MMFLMIFLNNWIYDERKTLLLKLMENKHADYVLGSKLTYLICVKRRTVCVRVKQDQQL